MQYIDNMSYFPGDTTVEVEWLNNRRENSVQLLQVRSPSPSDELSNFKVLSDQRLRTAAHGEKLLVQYRTRHELSGWSRN